MEQIQNINDLLRARAEQINNKSNAPVYGKAAQYRELLAVCKFKLVVYWNVKKNGQYYAAHEKDARHNRDYIPSIDTMRFQGRKITNHREAHSTLINYALQNISRLDAAMLIVNDHVNDLELTVFQLNKDHVAQSGYVDIHWKEKEDGSVIFNGLDGKALRTDKMRYHEY